MWPLIYLFVVILLPLVPAYILFRALPTRSSGLVTGTLFQGLEIKLGGSFAGYFALVVLLLINHAIWNPPPPPHEAYVWHLSGQIMDDTGQPVEGLDQKDFEFSPLTFQNLPGGHFSLTIPTEAQEGGGTRYPTVVIHHQDLLKHEDYLPLEIPVNPGALDAGAVASFGVSIDEPHKLLSMQHIHLKKAPAYNAKNPTTYPKLKSPNTPRPKASGTGGAQ